MHGQHRAAPNAALSPDDTVVFPRYREPWPQPGTRHRYRAAPPTGQPYPPVPYRQPPMRVAPKSPSAAIILSFLIPGVGSMYAGRAGIGALILGCCVVSWLLSFVLIGIPFLFATWVWGMIHAHGAAVRWNKQYGILS